MVRESGDKVIFMENGEPELVVMSFTEYEKLARANLPEAGNLGNQRARVHPDANVPQDIEEETAHETEFTAPHGAESMHPTIASHQEVAKRPGQGTSARLQDIRLEDLPI